MVKKVYLHYDGPEQLSKVFKISEDDRKTTFSDLIDRFVAAYNSKFGASGLESKDIVLRSTEGLQLSPRAIVCDSSAADVHVTRAGERGHRTSSGPLQQAEGPKESAILKPFLEKAAAAESKQHYRMAVTIYEQVLKKAPESYEALFRLTKLWRRAKRPAEALELAKTAAGTYPQDIELREQYADCVRNADLKEEALKEYNTVIVQAKEQGLAHVLSRASVSMAGVLYGMDRQCQDTAASMVMSILERDESHAGALQLYAMIAKDRGQLEEATRVLVRLLILDQDNADIKLQLAECLKTEVGMQQLLKSLEGSKDRGAALAFLATAVKDHGAVPTCIRLFQLAVESCPDNPSYVMNLMHAHELLQEYGLAIQVAIKFCLGTRLQLPGSHQFPAFAKALSVVPQMGKGYRNEWLALEPWTPAANRFPTESDVKAASQAEANHPTPASRQAAPAQEQTVQYSEPALDALAILMTAVKVLFLGGAIARAAELIRMIEPARLASSRPLHTTLIRNEAAYYSCIAQLLKDFPPPPTPHSLQPLFLCGDSHTLSGAWHTLSFGGQERLLVPLLVTGCKIWHMRKAGCFFPKMAWLSTLDSLRDGSELIFMFGEIDCREGLLLAVEKLKYDSMETAMAVLLDIYTETLLDLVERRHFIIHVHPVPSVLNETRHVVRPFNEALRAKIKELAALPSVGGRLQFLDLFDDLLTPDGLRLKPSLHLDGTHMNPWFLQVIEKALQQS